jgi:predicted O-methyltransferase YrrM
MRRVIPLALLVSLAAPLAKAEDVCHEKVQAWRDYFAWAQAQSGPAGVPDYRAKLLKDGIAAAQADGTVAVLGRLYEECTGIRNEAQRAGFNRLYRQETQDRFTIAPSEFLAAMVTRMKPGKPLDVAMGQGRNAVFLATQGWDVTGYDIAEEGLEVAQENARKAGVRITTVHAGWDDFDHGREQWDLISFIYMDAPVMDPRFIARIQAALEPGGYVLFDRPYRNLENPEPFWPEKEHDKPNALPKAWSDLQLVFYEDTNGVGDWQQTAVARQEYTQLRLVHMLARKPR